MAVPEPSGPDNASTYANLINSLGGIVWEADGRTFQFSFISPQAERILGYPIGEWLKQPDFWRAHTHPDDVERCTAFCRDATSHGKDHEFEYRMIAADGRVVWLRDIVTVARSPDGSIRLRGIMLDVSERKRMEEGLRQAAKLEAVGRLAGGVAHDFNNLLTVINGYAELLQAALKDHPAGAMAQQIRAAGDRAAALTHQLLAFGRRSVIAPRSVNLNDVVRRLDRLLRHMLGEGVLLSLNLEPALGPVHADVFQLEQIIVNLCLNARDAMPQGGRLSIETANVVLGFDRERACPEYHQGPHVLLRVVDTGVGIDQETLPHIFEPFFSTKEGGTGLGLATIYGIVSQAGGQVRVESKTGQGSEFAVYLPRSQGPAERVDEVVDGLASAGVGTVLLAEDDDALRGMVRTILEGQGYSVLEAANGRAAIELARSHSGQIDVLVTDIVMPGAGGHEVAKELLRLRSDLRVLFISGYTDDEVVRHGVREAEVHFLQKPFTPAALARKLREVLERS